MMKEYLREREKETKVSAVTGLVLTVAVHLLACLLLADRYSPQTLLALVRALQEGRGAMGACMADTVRDVTGSGALDVTGSGALSHTASVICWKPTCCYAHTKGGHR